MRREEFRGRQRRLASGALSVALLAPACFLPGRNREPALPPQSPARDTLLATDLARNDQLPRRGPAATMAELFDPAVMYLRAGAHVAYGSERATVALASLGPQTPDFTGWQPLGGGLSRDRLSGYTFGIAIRALAGAPGPTIERYVAFWNRNRGGPWRISGYLEVAVGTMSATPGAKSSPVPDSTRALRSMLAADSALAERASTLGPADAVRNGLADDGVLLTTPQLVVGPRAASDYYESRRMSVSWVPRDGRVAASGDLGFTIGDALATSVGPSGAATQRFSKYLTVWRRDGDGRWRVLLTGSNDRPSPIGD